MFVRGTEWRKERLAQQASSVNLSSSYATSGSRIVNRCYLLHLEHPAPSFQSNAGWLSPQTGVQERCSSISWD